MKPFITLYPDHVTVIIPHLNIDMLFLSRDLYEVEYTHDGCISASVYMLYERQAPTSVLLSLARLIQNEIPKNSIDWTLTFIPIFGGPTPRWLNQPDDELPDGTVGPYDKPVRSSMINLLKRFNLL